ncbi:hypothetical protein HAX54_040081 [Datura stramonium]|uniref:Uncharacterized protein n=1 Tax=Datura stramonium TaxID=4076 RepID=A0ABS8SJQ8_DATST|nr:hypothetical protein [Datura stramonium]
MDLLEDNTPRDMLALMGEGASIEAESSAIEADTPTTSSANRSGSIASIGFRVDIAALQISKGSLLETPAAIVIESDEEGTTKREHKRERKEIKEALQCFHEEMHTVGKFEASTSRARESAKKTWDYDSKVASQARERFESHAPPWVKDGVPKEVAVSIQKGITPALALS